MSSIPILIPRGLDSLPEASFLLNIQFSRHCPLGLESPNSDSNPGRVNSNSDSNWKISSQFNSDPIKLEKGSIPESKLSHLWSCPPSLWVTNSLIRAWFLSKGQWTYGPTLCLSIDTHIRSDFYRVVYVWVFLAKNDEKGGNTPRGYPSLDLASNWNWLLVTLGPLFWTET